MEVFDLRHLGGCLLTQGQTFTNIEYLYETLSGRLMGFLNAPFFILNNRDYYNTRDFTEINTTLWENVPFL